MFERLSDARKRRKIEKRFEPLLGRKIVNEADIHLHDRASVDANRAFDDLYYQIQSRETSRLLGEAERYDIEIARNQDDWEHSTPKNVLTTAARADLRKRIDEERTRRREVKAWWWKTIIAPVLTALTGLIGVIIGLVAVLKK